MRSAPSCVFALVAVTAAAVHAAEPSASPTLVELLRQNTHSIKLANGVLSGAGADWLARESAGAQFVLLGEQHNIAQIPPFTTALFSLLQERHGFQYFATEQPGLTLERLSTGPLRGRIDAIGAVAKRQPFAFSFIGDEELTMLADIGARSRAKAAPLWGLEQATGVVPYAEALLEIAPDGARPRTQALLQRALAKEVSPRDYRNGMFMADDPMLPEDLAELRKAFAPYPGSRADRLLGALERSREIYGYYARAEAGEPVGLYNNTVREESFREEFLHHYRVAAAMEDRPPRVLLKFGALHMARGRNRLNAYPIGNFIVEFARVSRLQALNITTVVYGTAADFEKGAAEYRWFAPLADRPDWAVIDLRPLRAYLNARRFRDTLDEPAWRALVEQAFTYDGLLLIPGALPKQSVLSGAKQ